MGCIQSRPEEVRKEAPAKAKAPRLHIPASTAAAVGGLSSSSLRSTPGVVSARQVSFAGDHQQRPRCACAECC